MEWKVKRCANIFPAENYNTYVLHDWKTRKFCVNGLFGWKTKGNTSHSGMWKKPRNPSQSPTAVPTYPYSWSTFTIASSLAARGPLRLTLAEKFRSNSRMGSFLWGHIRGWRRRVAKRHLPQKTDFATWIAASDIKKYQRICSSYSCPSTRWSLSSYEIHKSRLLPTFSRHLPKFARHKLYYGNLKMLNTK